MKIKLLKPNSKAIIYDDEKLYVCLANDSVTEGHTIIVWKDDVPDLYLLADRDYDYLMDTIFAVRNALLKTLKIKKVYLIYMDEANHVHWHLIPRYKEKGFDIFEHKPQVLNNFFLVKKIKKNLVFK
jgi:diadenosine tetraphosphate (Ap4A) HIT family hydrolase